MSSTSRTVEQRYGRVALTGAAVSILVALLGLAGLGWAYVSMHDMGMMMSGGADFGSFAIFMATWVVMMAAMMFPSVAPVVLVYAQYSRRQAAAWPVLASVFVFGYLVIWSGVGVLAYILLALIVPPIADLAAVRAAPQFLLGAVIAVAGLYQLTPLKDLCLGHCRSPLQWILRGVRPGAGGALRMGFEEGVFCVGCCIGLMAVLLAVGIASVGWMAAVAAVIFVEKLVAPTPTVAKAIGALLVAFGIGVATVPALSEFVLGGPRM